MLLHPLLPLLLLLLCCSAANNVRVQFTHGLVKLRPGEAPPPLTDGLWAARNEYESLQVVITAAQSTAAVVKGVVVGHPTLPSLQVAISSQNMINIAQVTNCECTLAF